LTECGVSRRNTQVTREREIAARARRWTIDRRNDRLRHLTNRENHAPPGAEYARELFRIATLHQLRHERDIAARTKPTTRAGDDDNANTAIAAGVFERLREIATHVTDERIQPVRTIQSDRQDAFSLCDLNVLVHASVP